MVKVDWNGGRLFVDGDWSESIFDSAVAVVGSRRMTEYGRRVVEKLVPTLVENGNTIISGFMYGVDQAAHEMALACGGRTVAVLGWGINYPMDSAQSALAKRIVRAGGLVVSEWENQVPTLWTFPLRNKIVVAMSREIYVIEAAIKSGALITADLAYKTKKKVWAVPGPVTSKVSEGTNWLIKSGRAQMWTPDDIICNKNKTDISIVLQNEALAIDDLARKVGRSVEEVGAELTLMMLKGEVVEKGGKYYLV